MSSERKVDPFAALILVFSIIGLILMLAFDFAAMDIGGGNWRYSCLLGCEYYSTGDLIAQIVVLILLIIQIIIVLNELLPNKFLDKDLDKIGMILAVLTIVFVVIGLGSFGITYSENEWWPETGFYGGIIAGLINAVLFFLKDRNK